MFNKLLLTWLVIFICIAKVIPNENEPWERVLIELENLSFEKAKQSIENLEDSDVKAELKILSHILYFKENLLNSDTLVILHKTSTSKVASILHLLNQGNFKLYVRPYESEAFKNLYDAYTMAGDLENKFLLKFTLLSILEFYHKEVTQSNTLFLEYLNQFGELADSDVDWAWFHLYQVILRSKTIFKLDEKFFHYHKKLDSIFNRLSKDDPLMAYYNLEKGLKFQLENEIDSASHYYIRNISMIKGEPYLTYKKFASYLKLSNIYSINGDQKKAINLAKKSAEFIGKGPDTLRNYYYLQKYISDYYSKISENDSAFKYLKVANSIASILNYRTNSIEVSKLYVQLNTREKEKQILKEQQKARTNRNWLIVAGALLLLGTGIAILIQKNTEKKRRLAEQEALLKEQRFENLLKEQELTSIDAMIAGQEKERTKVANELHDDLGSLMATVKLHFDNVKVDQKDPALVNAQKLLDEVYQKIRGMAHSKNSGVMADQGLLPAVKKMARTITETNALEVTVEDFGLGERLENSLELTIFRIIQELIANIIKHSQATKASIQFTQHDENLNIIVEDNGKGFEMSVAKRSNKGMGLGTIEKRIEHLEGTFTVDSVLGKGTSILIDIPV